MNAKDVFGIIIRVLGLLGVLWGCSYLGAIVFWLLGRHVPGSTIFYYFLASCLTLAVGIYFLRGAPRIVRFAYPDTEKKHEPGEER